MIIKNKLIILLIALSAFISANAQIKKNGWYYIPLPMNDSAEWSVVYQDGQHKDPVWRSFKYYKTLGDTFISGQTYKKVWTNSQHHKYYPTDTLVCMYRQDTAARRVYVRSAFTYYPDTNEYLFMDFGMHDSDTMVLPVFTRKSVYESRKFYVLGVDSHKTVIFGTPQKIYYDRIDFLLRTPDTNDLVYGDIWHPLRDYFPLEGVGSTRSTGPFFYPIARKEYYYETDMSNPADTIVYLHCLENGGFTRWLFKSTPSVDFCDKVLSIRPINYKLNTLVLFPNPCNEYIAIYTDESILDMHIEIFDISGKKVKTDLRTNTTGTRYVSTSNLTPGVFILHAYNNYGFNESYKIIKQ